MPVDPQQQTIDAILTTMRSVAVVGISDSAARPSNEVASYLLGHNFKVSFVNPLLNEVFGIPCYPSLAQLPEPVEIVDVFRRSSEAAAVIEQAITIGARAVWLQRGVIDEQAAARARARGLLVVMDRCMLEEHARRAAAGLGFA